MFSMKNGSLLGLEPTTFVATLTAYHTICALEELAGY